MQGARGGASGGPGHRILEALDVAPGVHGFAPGLGERDEAGRHLAPVGIEVLESAVLVRPREDLVEGRVPGPFRVARVDGIGRAFERPPSLHARDQDLGGDHLVEPCVPQFRYPLDQAEDGLFECVCEETCGFVIFSLPHADFLDAIQVKTEDVRPERTVVVVETSGVLTERLEPDAVACVGVFWGRMSGGDVGQGHEHRS